MSSAELDEEELSGGDLHPCPSTALGRQWMKTAFSTVSPNTCPSDRSLYFSDRFVA